MSPLHSGFSGVGCARDGKAETTTSVAIIATIARTKNIRLNALPLLAWRLPVCRYYYKPYPVCREKKRPPNLFGRGDFDGGHETPGEAYNPGARKGSLWWFRGYSTIMPPDPKRTIRR